MSVRRFVKDTYSHLSKYEQEEEIKALEEAKIMKQQMHNATINSWNN
jgi:predicted RecB family endonuclease